MPADKRNLAIALAIVAVIVVGSRLFPPEPVERHDEAPVVQPVERDDSIPAAQDVRALTGKTSVEVAAALGEPDSCSCSQSPAAVLAIERVSC